jgi:nitrate reductase delta subunit
VSRRRPTVSAADQVIALQAAALLLDYPDAALFGRLPVLRQAADLLPEQAATPLRQLLDHFAGITQHQAEQAYVDLFDLRRRCCLYLTYYAFGDTRKRGMALLKFTHSYKSAGLELLAENRAGIELIRLALAEAGSPYVHALDLLRAVLPDPAPRDLERAMELARTGPPEEEVGLEPFAPPEYMGAIRR